MAYDVRIGKLQTAAVRERGSGMLANMDKTLAARVSDGPGIRVPNETKSESIYPGCW